MKKIVSNPNIQGGIPTFEGTRIPVSVVKSYIAANKSIAEIIEDYPDLTIADIENAITWKCDKCIDGWVGENDLYPCDCGVACKCDDIPKLTAEEVKNLLAKGIELQDKLLPRIKKMKCHIHDPDDWKR